MTDLHTAAKQALKALEETRNALAWFYDSYPQDVTPKGGELLPHVETVLTALRQALEQPAQYDTGIYGPFGSKAPPAPPRPKTEQPAQQEPVATQWLAEMIMSDCGCSTQNQRLVDRIVARIEQYDRANKSPTAREPLTKTKVGNYLRRHAHGEVGMYRNGFKDGVLFAEAAHGIGEKK